MAGLKVGYPGLTYTAKGIALHIPKCKVFVEPFAGLGRISEHVVADKYVLNDMSDFAVLQLKQRFPNYIVTQQDFIKCIEENDSEETTFFFDPPWSRVDYAENPKTFCDRGVGEYYKKLAEIVKTLKGNWYCAGRVSGGARSCVTVYFKDYEHFIVESEHKICGYPARTKVYYKCL